MKKYRLVSLFLIIMIVSTLKGMDIPPDSCLKMICNNDIDEWGARRNPDSVKVDSCVGSSTFGNFFAKKFFLVRFKNDLYPFNSVIQPEEVKTVDSIRNNLTNIKLQLQSIVDSLGQIFFIRSMPGIEYYPDSVLIKNVQIYFYFDSYQDIEVVLSLFRQVDSVKSSHYFLRTGPYTYVTSDLALEQNNIYPNPVTDFISLGIDNSIKEEKFTIYNVLGIKVLEDLYSEKLDVRDLPTGTYFLKFLNKTYHFLKY